MTHPIQTIITATGSAIPTIKVSNEDFAAHSFFDKNGAALLQDQTTILEKFKGVSGIQERRYAEADQQASDLGCRAALAALESSGIDPETLDYMIVAHNFGDVLAGSNRVDLVPSLASRIKSKLAIKNPNCVAYDLAFGCPGWLEGVIQANYYIRSGDARRCMVVGAETLSRIVDPHDRDCMLFGDGAGAVILEASTTGNAGIQAHLTQTHAHEYAQLLSMSRSSAPQASPDDLFMKMNGRKLYEFALTTVPQVIKAALDKANVSLSSVKKVLIHQANDKMDTAILQRVFKLYGLEELPHDLMPMTISWLGNSSVATIPTLLDLIMKGNLQPHELRAGDLVVFASVGAGMNVNAVIYRF